MLSPILARAQELLPHALNRGELRLHEVVNDDPERLHHALTRFNVRRLRPALPHADDVANIWENAAALVLEREFIERERERVAPLLRDVPSEPDAFVTWYEFLREQGPGQGDDLVPWLGEHATAADMRWFLRQEMAGEAGFDDLLAMTQLQLATGPRLELARNYWDEMGRGKEGAMHGPMLGAVGEEFGLHEDDPEPVVWESLALANLLVGLAANRPYVRLSNTYHHETADSFRAAGVRRPGVIKHLTKMARLAEAEGWRRVGREGRPAELSEASPEACEA